MYAQNQEIFDKNIVVKNIPSSATTPERTAISLQSLGYNDKIHAWDITTATFAGFHGVSSNAFEVWEYPSLLYPNSNCCMKRFSIESARDRSHTPVIIGYTGNLFVGYHTTPTTTNELTVNGNVGIGTTDTEGSKLAVNGTIRAKEIKVETGWADFVFEEDYELPSLEEVSNHIKEKKHLPGIPSAKEVKENGVNLGEMNVMLLQKIEELTLYVIKQQNIIEKLDRKILEIENTRK